MLTLHDTEEQLMVHDKVFDENLFTTLDTASRTYSPTHRRKTYRHRQLLERYGQPSESWSSRALHACLHTLAFNTSSETWCVGVLDAWIDGESAFCVVYRYRDDPRTLGTRRLVDDHGDPYGPAPTTPSSSGTLSPPTTSANLSER